MPNVKPEDVDIFVKDRLKEKETTVLASAASKLTKYREAKAKSKEDVVIITKFEFERLLTPDEAEVMKKCSLNPKFIKIM